MALVKQRDVPLDQPEEGNNVFAIPGLSYANGNPIPFFIPSTPKNGDGKVQYIAIGSKLSDKVASEVVRFVNEFIYFHCESEVRATLGINNNSTSLFNFFGSGKEGLGIGVAPRAQFLSQYMVPINEVTKELRAQGGLELLTVPLPTILVPLNPYWQHSSKLDPQKKSLLGKGEAIPLDSIRRLDVTERPQESWPAIIDELNRFGIIAELKEIKGTPPKTIIEVSDRNSIGRLDFMCRTGEALVQNAVPMKA